MILKTYLTEIKIFSNISTEDKEKHNINIIFDYAIKKCFSEAYQEKIETFFQNKKINIKEVSNGNFLMKTIGNTIFINMKEMQKRDNEQNVKYLLHEFIHVLQGSKALLFKNKFPELISLSKKLEQIANRNLTKSLAEFFTSRKQNLMSSGSEEYIAYLMNGAMDFSALKDNGKEYKETIIQSGIFNTTSDFWKNRL